MEIIIKNDSQYRDHRPMRNMIPVCDCIAKYAEDGDEVEVTIKGKLIDKDGVRFISIDSVDGEDVEDMEKEMNSMDSQDALEHFMNKIKG